MWIFIILISQDKTPKYKSQVKTSKNTNRVKTLKITNQDYQNKSKLIFKNINRVIIQFNSYNLTMHIPLNSNNFNRLARAHTPLRLCI